MADIDVHNKRHGRSGRKGIDIAKMNEALLEVPLKNRTTQRAAAQQLGIHQSKLCKNLKRLGMRASSRFVEPGLTEQAKSRRLAWALRWVRDCHGGTRTFDTMGNVVMVDDKWFSIPKQGQRYILADGEDPPVHKLQHKSHIEKVVFLAVVGRPQQPQLQWEVRHLPVHQAGAGPTKQQAQGCGYDGDADDGGEQGGLQGEDAELCLPRHQGHVAVPARKRNRPAGQCSGPQHRR